MRAQPTPSTKRRQLFAILVMALLSALIVGGLGCDTDYPNATDRRLTSQTPEIPALPMTSDTVFQVRIGVAAGEDGHGVMPGTIVSLPVTLTGGAALKLRGFQFLIGYDAQAIGTPTPEPSSVLFGDSAWEYFTWRNGAQGECDSTCPSGMITLVGISETNNGPHHPDSTTLDSLALPYELFRLRTLATTDAAFESSLVPVRFWWADHFDNVLAFGDSLPTANVFPACSRRVYAPMEDGHLTEPVSGEYIDITDSAGAFPNCTGMPDTCFQRIAGSIDNYQKRADFVSGGVVFRPVSLGDRRGDLNLNGIAYEIADAILFAHYFTYGLGVFAGDMDKHAQASDANANGTPFELADLVYMSGVITGALYPIMPDSTQSDYQGPVSVSACFSDGVLSVNTPVAAACLEVRGDVSPENLTSIEMRRQFDGVCTHILLWDLEGGTLCGGLLSVAGATTNDIVRIECAVSPGWPTTVTLIDQPTADPPVVRDRLLITFPVEEIAVYRIVVLNWAGVEVGAITDAHENGWVNAVWDGSTHPEGPYVWEAYAHGALQRRGSFYLTH